jgi:Autotransporter beta-domain
VKQTHIFLNGSIVVLAIVGFATTAKAQSAQSIETISHRPVVEQNTEPALGQRGQWYLHTPSLFASHTHYDPDLSGALLSSNSLSLSAEVGRFVRDHFSLGVEVGGQYGWQTQNLGIAGSDSDRFANWTASLHLLAGWQRPLAAWLSFWPKVMLGGSYGRMDNMVYDAVAGTDNKETSSSYSIDAGLRLPVVLHVTRHLFVEAAWSLYASFGHNQQFNSIEAMSLTSLGFGGWI